MPPLPSSSAFCFFRHFYLCFVFQELSPIRWVFDERGTITPLLTRNVIQKSSCPAVGQGAGRVVLTLTVFRALMGCNISGSLSMLPFSFFPYLGRGRARIYLYWPPLVNIMLSAAFSSAPVRILSGRVSALRLVCAFASKTRREVLEIEKAEERGDSSRALAFPTGKRNECCDGDRPKQLVRPRGWPRCLTCRKIATIKRRREMVG